MEELKVPVTGGWRLAIGSGPRILAECTGRNIVEIAQAIDTSLFRKLVRTLKNALRHGLQQPDSGPHRTD